MRPVTVEDSDELSLLEMDLFPDNCLNEYTLAREIDLGMGFVVTDNHKIVAYMLLRGNGYLMDIMRLGVLEKYQGQGLGTRLLRVGMQMAEQTMLTVEAKNERALRLYSRHGFQIVGRLLGDTAWVMGHKKRLRQSDYFIGLDR